MRQKKSSPSSLRRNERRRQEFLEQRKPEETEENAAKETEVKSAECSEMLSCNVCDISTKSRKDLNIHMLKQHKDLEQLNGNVSLNSTVVEEHKELYTKPETLETIADFRITVEDTRTEEKVNNELQKHWDSRLNVLDFSWDTVKVWKGRYIIDIELEVGQSMNQLLENISWPEGYTLGSTHLKKLVYHKYKPTS